MIRVNRIAYFMRSLPIYYSMPIIQSTGIPWSNDAFEKARVADKPVFLLAVYDGMIKIYYALLSKK